MNIKVYEREWPDEAQPGGKGRRLVIDVPRIEIEEDDSGRPGSFAEVLAELRQLSDQIDQATRHVTARVHDFEKRWCAAFVAQSLNMLPRTDEASEDDPPCCASECAPCGALVQLHARGLLSEWVRPYVHQAGTGWDWWDGGADSGEVNWDWVSARICADPAKCTAPGWCCSSLDGTDDVRS